MDGSSLSQKNSIVKGKLTQTRRTWTLQEEQKLLCAFKDIVVRGWKCDNGFKTGYLATLEGAMFVSFPGTDLKAEPHIHSNIHVWKKTYASLSTMLSRSGIGWNDSSCTIDVQDDEAWTEYVKTDPHARTMRYKAWRYYKDWTVIFGKDRATGEYAEAFVEAVNDVGGSSKRKEPSHLGEASGDGENNSFMSISGGDTATSSKSTRKLKKKRARVDDVDVRLVEMMAKFFDKADDKLGHLVKIVGFEFDVSESRKKVFDALSSFHYLSGEDKLNVTKKLCEMAKDMDIFFSVNDEHKAFMVAMILQGRY